MRRDGASTITLLALATFGQAVHCGPSIECELTGEFRPQSLEADEMCRICGNGNAD
jgi:hypothetical protein